MGWDRRERAKRVRFLCVRVRGGLISASFPRELRRLRARSKRAGRRRVRRRRLGFLRGVRGGRRGRGRGRGFARQRRRPGVRPERTGRRQRRASPRARARPGLWPSPRRQWRRVRLLGGVAPERPRLARLRLDWHPCLGGEARPLERLAGRHGLARRRRLSRPAEFDLARRSRIRRCGPRWAFVRVRLSWLFVVRVHRRTLHQLFTLCQLVSLIYTFLSIFARHAVVSVPLDRFGPLAAVQPMKRASRVWQKLKRESSCLACRAVCVHAA